MTWVQLCVQSGNGTEVCVEREPLVTIIFSEGLGFIKGM